MNRVTQILGSKYPIIQAPMGWIARSKLASAVSNAGALALLKPPQAKLKTARMKSWQWQT